MEFSLKVYITFPLSKLTSYSRSNFTEELGKAGWAGVYFITPSNIHTTGVRKPLFLVAKNRPAPFPNCFFFLKTSICITWNIKAKMKGIETINNEKKKKFTSFYQYSKSCLVWNKKGAWIQLWTFFLWGMLIGLHSWSLGRTCYDTDKKQKHLVCLSSLTIVR